MTTKISVYIDNGNVFDYEVTTEASAREHADAIVKTGYRSVTEAEPDVLTWYPPHRIVKVKVKLPERSSTAYFDKPRST